MGDRKGTALLLAAAAVVGAVLGAAASMASAKASGAWQAAVRRQLEHDAIRAGLDQLHQLSDARRSGAKRSRAVFALSLVALAGVLAGRAAVFGAGRSASTCLAAAAVSLVAAAAWGNHRPPSRLVTPMRIATWNVNSLKIRLPRVEEWLQYAEPDVLCMQETKLADSAFPALAFQTLGYEAAHCGQGQWNGVAILSRVGLKDVVAGFSDQAEDEVTEARLLWASCGGVRVGSVYVPNGRQVGSEHYEAKLQWLDRLRRHVESSCDPDEPLIVCGDFNVAPTDDDAWDPSKLHGATHVSPPEREAVGALLDWGLVDVFRTLRPEPKIFSWWDYRAGDFHEGRGLRIDLALASKPLAERATFALIDRNARKGKQPSDHAPMLIDFDL